MSKNYNVAVVGAGVVGLSTALSIKTAFPMFSVTIFADKFDEDTLSSGAGGLFRPEISAHHDSTKVRTWCSESLSHFFQIINSSEAAEAGMQLVSGYHLSSTPVHPKNQLLQELLPQYTLLDDKTFASKMFPEKYKKGVHFATVITDCRYYLPWLKCKFETIGGKVQKEHFSNLSDVPDQYDIIINCCGLGAKQLINDHLLLPIRGQTIRVKAPWIKHFFYGDDVYIIPGVDYITLGGVKDYGSWNLEVNQYQKQFIWDKCTELVPSLKKAEIIKDWVGLRPYRSSVRVDSIFVPCNGKYKLVINNYGHGGHGVTLSWGTAQEVTRIIKELILKDNFVVSKL